MLSFINIIDYLNFYCAPCLLGKKPASLFSMPIETYRKSYKEAASLKVLGLSIHFLYELNKKALLLVFSEQKTRDFLDKDDIRKAYTFFGYEDGFTFEELKTKLFDRFNEFASTKFNSNNEQYKSIFPHEIGLFLGYPPEDVLQYYLKKGKDYLFSGYWKVYTNPEKAIRTFKLYDACRVYCMKEARTDFYHLLSA